MKYHSLIIKINLSFIAFFILGQSIGVKAASVQYTIQTQERYPFRVLEGCEPDEYWVVDQASGLILLFEDPSGNWSFSEYPIGYVWDAVGPDSQGRIFCCGSLEGVGSVVQVFDCNTKTVSANIVLGQGIPISSISLSPDESRIYVIGCDWPRFGEMYSPSDSVLHPDSGIVWEIDTTTYEIINQGITGALPETIYCTESGTLLVSTQEYHYIPPWHTTISKTDILSCERGLPRIGQISCTHTLQSYANDFADWSDELPLVAICCLTLEPLAYEDEYRQGLWILDTETNEIIERFSILDIDGRSRGIHHATRSSVYPDRAYVSFSYGSPSNPYTAAAIDMETGEVIELIPTGEEMTAEFIYEMPDGRLIITGGTYGRILIVDPT